MPYYLGIDGGGTKTTCAVGDDSQLLATATSGPSNIVRVGEAQARESLQRSVRQACASAGITPAQIAHTCVGGSGAARPELAATVRRFLAEMISTPIDVLGDNEILLEAAFGTGPGVVVIGGTGSMAYGRNAQGKTARAGGWGFAIGDEGSAHWIGREAVRAVLRTADATGEETAASIPQPDASLKTSLVKIWSVTSLLDLARAASSVPPPDFAALFPAVANSQDDVAIAVLTTAGRELARVVALVSRRLFAADVARVPVATTGGVFRYSQLVRQVFYNELRTLDPRTEIKSDVVEPVEGALSMARRAAQKR